MSVKAKDALFSRWLLDPKFRTLLDNTPEVALAGYELTVQERETLLNTLSRPRRYRARHNATRICFPTSTYFKN
jgi:hypothetical protein